MKSNKVAICFYGQTRVPIVINKWWKKLEKKYDFFISTWDDEDSDKLDFDFTDNEFFKFDKYFVKLSKMKVRVSTLYYACYLIKKVINLKEKYEIKTNQKYDWVLLIRPDVIIDLDLLEKEIEMLGKITQMDIPIIKLNGGLNISPRSGRVEVINDLFFFINKKSLKIFESFFEDFFMRKNKIYNSVTKSRGGHDIFSSLIILNNLLVLDSELSGFIVRKYIHENILSRNIRKRINQIILEFRKEESLWDKSEKIWKKGDLRLFTGKTWKLLNE
jgi:hypothetical protein|tara:strand:+ start:2420 stop:3241 length:822 start_codon:yes stop_codon:yes gene_type:complete